MNKNLTVLIDMDDTIEDLLGEWVRLLNARYGLNVDKCEITEWNVGKFFPSLSNDQVYSVLDERELWENVKPIHDSVEYVKRIIDDGHTVFICTATGYKHVRMKMDIVLFKYFPYLSWENVIVTSCKQLIRADILIDDGVHNLVGGVYSKVLMDAPSNKQYDAEANGMKRVYNWKQAYEYICAYQDGGV